MDVEAESELRLDGLGSGFCGVSASNSKGGRATLCCGNDQPNRVRNDVPGVSVWGVVEGTGDLGRIEGDDARSMGDRGRAIRSPTGDLLRVLADGTPRLSRLGVLLVRLR